jgi:hypothetical protein
VCPQGGDDAMTATTAQAEIEDVIKEIRARGLSRQRRSPDWPRLALMRADRSRH